MTRLGPRAVRLVPLGGLGEIGANCMALETDDGILVVDCGTCFPQDDLGIDVIHPDFRWLLERGDRVAGVFLTHGHEDHVGALPYLLRSLDCPVYGPAHALAVLDLRLADRGGGRLRPRTRTVEPRGSYRVGPFDVEPIRVTHSIVEATALAITTPAGVIVHTGDFKLEDEPPDGERTDEERLRELGDAGVRLLLSDSTNSDVPAPTTSERVVGQTLEELVAAAPRRVVIGMFASNVQRLIEVGRVARRTGRRIALLGRSLSAQVELARRLGRLRWPSDLELSADALADAAPERVLVLAGGSQAERASSLRRLSLGEHGQLALEEGDTVILSSRVIPGNERVVHEMHCDLRRLGVRVVDRRVRAEVHSSGHAARSEQGRMLELVRPRGFVPVHGTLHHLLEHAALARARGVAEVEVIENGSTLVVSDEGLALGDEVPVGKIHVAQGGAVLDDETLEARAELGRSGVVVVSLPWDGAGFAGAPVVQSVGVPELARDPAARRAISHAAERAVRRAGTDDPESPALAEQVERAVRRATAELVGVRPVVRVSAVEVDD